MATTQGVGTNRARLRQSDNLNWLPQTGQRARWGGGEVGIRWHDDYRVNGDSERASLLHRHHA